MSVSASVRSNEDSPLAKKQHPKSLLNDEQGPFPTDVALDMDNQFDNVRMQLFDYSLSMVWLTLCSVLVHEHQNLILIFYAFVSCFILSGMLSYILYKRNCIRFLKQRQEDGDSSTSNTITKNLVGIFVCIISSYVLVQSIIRYELYRINDNKSEEAIRGYNENNQHQPDWYDIATTTYRPVLAIHVSLSLIAGYLAYDHWYTAIYCRRSYSYTHQRNPQDIDHVLVTKINKKNSSSNIFRVAEDAVTLTVILIVLVHILPNNERIDSPLYIFLKKLRLPFLSFDNITNILIQRKIDNNILCILIPLLWTLYKNCIISSELAALLSPLHSSMPNKGARGAVSSSLKIKGVKPLKISGTSTSTVPTFDRRTQNEIHPSMVWNIYNHQYDLSSYIHLHPGGVEAIMLGCNRPDCTALFQSYHPFTIRRAKSILQKYQVQTPTPTQLPKKTVSKPVSSVSFSNSDAKNDTIIATNSSNGKHNEKPIESVFIVQRHKTIDHTNDPFYDELCRRVAKKLESELNVDPIKDRAATCSRAIYYVLITGLLFVSLYFHCHGSVMGSFFLAVFGWLIGSLGHDAGHFAASRYPLLNDIGVWGMSLLCNPIVWQHQHTYAHHSHTNDFHHDPDLHHFVKFLRVHRKFQQTSVYRNQSSTWYVYFAYTLVCFGTCFWIPLNMILEGTLYGMVDWTDKNRTIRTIGMYLHLLAYIGVIMILPLIIHTSPIWGAASVVIHISTSGLLFAIFSQINHINERSFETKSEGDEHEVYQPHPDTINSWAATQIRTSNNFCPNSLVWHILSNGLNLQIEHHLFPGLNHCHLSLIQPTVQEVCKEYGVPYKTYDSWNAVMNATLRWLTKLSLDDIE